jgi:phospholipid/cholesterol/gamma-HCH transport system permease protein
VQNFDLFSGIFKSFFFGGAIALISCYRGFTCTPGAEGVGRAATAAFVWSFVMILAIDLTLGRMMYTIYYEWFPNASKLF